MTMIYDEDGNLKPTLPQSIWTADDGGVGEWPNTDEDDAPPLGQREEFRIICEVCHRDFGGTVGAKNPETHWITCPRCKAIADGTYDSIVAKGQPLTKTTGAD
jgi:hypothetical protein